MEDLTQPISTGMQTFPGDPAVTVESAATVAADGYAVASVSLGSHTGTHVDAPAHVFADGRTIDTYPPERFVFDAVRVDCRDLGPRAPIRADSVPEADADCVVFWTGWDRHWGTPTYRDHPYLTAAAAERCVTHDLAVASDTLNPDPTPTARATDHTPDPAEPDGVPAHERLLGNDRLVIENLTGLGALPDQFELRAFPLALGDDGAPVRAVGVPDA
ncbi:MAG: cyclase family protein [Halobaculum sp.]